MTRGSSHYTFGDTDTAAERLVLLARAYHRSSHAWLTGLRLARGGRVVDLGCGPGLTTALIADVLEPRALYGLDQSERLLARARMNFSAGVTFTAPARFVQHDLTVGPLPVPEADVLYARFLLTHLAEPARVLAVWAKAVGPNGCLLLEEVAALHSDHPVFARYYALVQALQAHYGQITYIGAELEALATAGSWKVEAARREPIALPAATMAALHALNLRTWREDTYAREAFDAAELSSLTGMLEAIARGTARASDVICTMAQAVLRT